MSVFIGYPSFMAYQMMKGKKGNNDGFPSIPGIVARYSASGLTNEQMKENPVWVDKTGNGHDLQMKNFAWKGMSGVGGYGNENHQTFYKFTLDDYVFIATPMEIFKDKYYTQSKVLYKCIRDSGQPLSHNLSDLVGNYVEKA